MQIASQPPLLTPRDYYTLICPQDWRSPAGAGSFIDCLPLPEHTATLAAPVIGLVLSSFALQTGAKLCFLQHVLDDHYPPRDFARMAAEMRTEQRSNAHRFSVSTCHAIVTRNAEAIASGADALAQLLEQPESRDFILRRLAIAANRRGPLRQLLHRLGEHDLVNPDNNDIALQVYGHLYSAAERQQIRKGDLA